MINKKTIRFVGIFLITGILVSLLSVLASGFGISVPGAALEMAPGETKDIQLVMSSAPTEGDLTINVILEKGAEIVAIKDGSTEYSLPTGGGTSVNLRITIPIEAADGTIYPIRLVMRGIAPSEGGTVSTVGEVGADFSVLVKKPPAPTETPKPESNALWWVLGIIVIVAIILVIYFTLKGKKK